MALVSTMWATFASSLGCNRLRRDAIGSWGRCGSGPSAQWRQTPSQAGVKRTRRITERREQRGRKHHRRHSSRHTWYSVTVSPVWGRAVRVGMSLGAGGARGSRHAAEGWCRGCIL
eukprot:5450864-Prymnesium_polylepis.1